MQAQQTQTQVITFKSIKGARAITGGDISNSNSKMRGSSFGLSPFHCKKGALLAKIEGSVCHDCYAKRGTGIYPSVKGGRINNTLKVLEAMQTPEGKEQWIAAMVYLIDKRCEEGYHRWHDAGDIQNLAHFEAIIEIAHRLPHIKFWLPTKESSTIKNYKGAIPDNLCVRLSGSMVDGKVPSVDSRYNTSTVHKNNEPIGFSCPAPQQNNKCGSCSACYNKYVLNVSYHKH